MSGLSEESSQCRRIAERQRRLYIVGARVPPYTSLLSPLSRPVCDGDGQGEAFKFQLRWLDKTKLSTSSTTRTTGMSRTFLCTNGSRPVSHSSKPGCASGQRRMSQKRAPTVTRSGCLHDVGIRRAANARYSLKRREFTSKRPSRMQRNRGREG